MIGAETKIMWVRIQDVAEGDKSYGYGVYKMMVRMQGHKSKQFQTTTSSNHYQVVAATFRDLLCVVPRAGFALYLACHVQFMGLHK